MRSFLLPNVKINFHIGISRRALIDTSACANVISNRLLQEITETDKNAVKLKQPDCTSFKIAIGQLVRIEKQAEIKFKLAHREFVKTSSSFPQKIRSSLATPALSSMIFQLAQNKPLFNSPDLTVKITEIKPVNEKRRAVRHKKIPIYTNKNHTIQPNEQIFLECYMSDKTDKLEIKME